MSTPTQEQTDRTALHLGKITTWNADRGFGFITPADGGGRVFVHVSAFLERRMRPAEDAIVYYHLTKDERGRSRAQDVEVVRSRIVPTYRGTVETPYVFLIALFAAALVWSGVMRALPWYVPVLYVFVSLVTYGAYSQDKAAAQRDEWRIAENTLHLLGVLGGWPGALVAQRRLPHKTRKLDFQVTFWGTVLMNIVGLVMLTIPESQRTIMRFLRL